MFWELFTSLNIFIRITSFLTQDLEKETVNHLCCYNETNNNKSQVIQIFLLYFMADFLSELCVKYLFFLDYIFLMF